MRDYITIQQLKQMTRNEYIRWLYYKVGKEKDFSQRWLAKEFGLSQTQIGRILKKEKNENS